MTGTIATKRTAKGELRWYAVASTGVDPATNRRRRAWYGPFPSEELAQQKLWDLNREVSEQTFVAPAKKVTVRSFFLVWIEGVRLRPSTV